MRGFCALILALSTGLFAGCSTDAPVRSMSWFQTPPGFRGPVGSDVVQMEWALIERPVGDRYLNDGVWALANEQAIPLERKDVLQDNGLRIAQLGGIAPPEFLEMLKSERSNPSPRRRQVRAGQATTLAIGPMRAKSQIPPLSGAERTASDAAKGELADAQYSFVVTPTLTSDGKTRLAIAPQIQHGKSKMVIKPAEDGSGWTCKEQSLAERFSELRWEVTLTPGEYLVVGCWFDRQQTYGQECFVRIDEPKPVQRLLVIRTSRQLPDATSDAASETGEEDRAAPRAVPIALQATGTPSRDR